MILTEYLTLLSHLRASGITLIAQAGCMTIYLSKAPMNDVLPGDVREEEIPDQIRRPAKTELLGEIVLAQDEILYFKNDDPLEAYWREINSARLCLIACSNRNVTDNADEFIQSFLGREAEECYIDLFEAANQVNSESDDL